MRQAAPIAQLGELLQNAEGSAEIIEKLKAGQPLTAAERKEARDELHDTTNLTMKQIDELLDKKLQKLETSLWEGQKAEKEMDSLHQRAMKEFPGYENIYKSPEFKRLQSYVLNDAQNDPTLIPADEPDPYWWIIKESIGILEAKNPGLFKEKAASKSESERKGAIAGQSQRSGGAPETQEDQIPDYIKNLGSRKFGGRLSDLRPKKR